MHASFSRCNDIGCNDIDIASRCGRTHVATEVLQNKKIVRPVHACPYSGKGQDTGPKLS